MAKIDPLPSATTIVTSAEDRAITLLAPEKVSERTRPEDVEAVLCAVEVQATLTKSVSYPSSADPLELRIGITLGDILISEDGDIFGDNVAARLEEIADPGSVFVSGKVFEEIEGRLSLPFEDRGEQRLKNIARPIRVYALKTGETSLREPKAARLPSPLGDKPSIAVLPFTNEAGETLSFLSM